MNRVWRGEEGSRSSGDAVRLAVPSVSSTESTEPGRLTCASARARSRSAVRLVGIVKGSGRSRLEDKSGVFVAVAVVRAPRGGTGVEIKGWGGANRSSSSRGMKTLLEGK